MTTTRQYKDIRHPTDSDVGNPTYSPPFISIGKKDRALLSYLSESHTPRFNVKAYSRLTGIPRPTIYDSLNRLTRLGLILKENLGCHKLTEIGKAALEVSEGSVGTPRRECRSKSNLSTHYLKYSMQITDRSKFNDSRLKDLGAKKIIQRKLQATSYYDIYFDDVTIRLFPKKVIIRIHDIIGDDLEEGDFKAFTKVTDYIKKVDAIGIKMDNITLEPSHYARMESIFADALQQIDSRYYLDLGEGRKFWIDNSGGKKAEDETNDLNARERLDTFLKDMFKSEALMTDIDKMKEAVGSIIRLEIINSKDREKIRSNLIELSRMTKENIAIANKFLSIEDRPLDDGENKKLQNYFG